MKNKIFSLVFIIFITLVTSVISYESYGNAIGYSHTMNKMTEKLHMEDNLKNSGKKILEKITFSLYDGYTESIEEIRELKSKGERYLKNAFRFTKAFIGIVLLTLVVYLISVNQTVMVSLIIISAISLLAGWFNPILELTAYQDLPVLGNTIFQYESKSIISAVYKMLDKQQYAIVSIIILFTIITPLIKTLLLLTISFQKKLHLTGKRVQFLTHIGKWSMLDVFVVAIIVTYFSMKPSGQTDANLQIGVYYFSVYVILSMICTYVLTFKKNK